MYLQVVQMLVVTVVGEYLPPHVALYTVQGNTIINYVDWKLHRGPLWVLHEEQASPRL